MTLVVAILGAESTGKTDLAEAACARLAQATGLRCTWVPEHLRAWCDAQGRTPRRHEQHEIASTQARLIEQAAEAHELVLCDTTPLMTAVYSEHVFSDRSLYPGALDWHRRCQLSLVTALDLPWVPDGVQRDGPQAQEAVDALLRGVLIREALPWSLVAGQGPARVEAAIDAIAPLLRQRATPHAGLFTRLAEREAAQPLWRWACDQCDEPECEHALRRLAPAAGGGPGQSSAADP